MPRSATKADDGRGKSTSYELDTQIGFLLRLAFQRHTVIFADLFHDELTTTQWAVISKLEEVGACSQNHLGRLTAMDVATIKGVVERLVKRGFVQVSPDLVDRRRLIVALTEDGHRAYERLVEAAHAVSVATVAPLDAGEVETLRRLLKRIT